MKRLILLRHAKAAAKDAARDFERVLSPAGRAEMGPVTAYLARDGRRPDLALVSTAQRTRETWDLASAKLDAVPVAFEERIYEASPEQLLGVLQEADGVLADGPLETIVLVGHNPGISDLSQMLVEGGMSVAKLAQGMPTAGIVVIDADIEAWSGLAAGSGRLVEIVSPASLGQGQQG